MGQIKYIVEVLERIKIEFIYEVIGFFIYGAKANVETNNIGAKSSSISSYFASVGTTF